MGLPATSLEPSTPSGKMGRRLERVPQKPSRPPAPSPIHHSPSQRIPPLQMKRALELYAGQQEAANDTSRDEEKDDSILSDDSAPGEGPRSSVLDIGRRPKSYTDGQEEEFDAPVAGGGYMEEPWMEMERMKNQDRQQQETQSQLLGDDVNGLSAPQSSMQKQTTTTSDVTADGEAADQGQLESARAQAFDAERTLADRDRIKKEMRQKIQAEFKQRMKRMKNSAKTTRYTIEGVEVASSEVLLPLLLLILQLNIQLAWKYLFKKENETGKRAYLSAFLDQSLAEDVATIFLDQLICMTAIIFNPLSIMILFFLLVGNLIPGFDTIMKLLHSFKS